MSSVEPPRFEVGQEVLVDEGLPGEVTAVKRGTVPGALGLPPLETWLYAVKSGAGGDLQTNVPEYNVVAGGSRRFSNLIGRALLRLCFDHRNEQYRYSVSSLTERSSSRSNAP